MNAEKSKALRKKLRAIAVKLEKDPVPGYESIVMKVVGNQTKDAEGNITYTEQQRVTRVCTGWKRAYRFMKKVASGMNKKARRGIR